MNKSVIQLITDNKTSIIERWMSEMGDVTPESAIHSTNEKIAEANNETFAHLIFSYMAKDGDFTQLNEFVKRILEFGYPLNYLTRGLQLFRRVMIEVTGHEANDTKELLKIYQDIEAIMDSIFNRLIEDATEQWENTVAMQKNALLELSAPLIPIMDSISVMPLIGTIDTDRAKLIMENLLNGVIENRSEVVLIDITGVPVVDTMVAHHILQAAEAVHLVGAECILVGIRPEIAQTIVNLGIELGEFPTKSTLRKGIETALGMTKRKIVDTDQEA
ncbi:STAS domain-containing protein [Tuberibacillus sp. Marseille-P3662]|uniref:STAS domain-containing protein n=1 Tax=Tuberibacillus sp. Marseille-P3662 TaxID=1965358 RepID=UPI000A1CDAA3|nr:STAS domain-containing protein [Tuberibacillus sp. Marseille-P3662]